MFIVRNPIKKSEIAQIAKDQFGDMVKAVVDVEKEIMAIGGELHADEEAWLLEEGSLSKNIWGINLYPENSDEEMVEFDSLMNIRPSLNNRSRTVEDETLRHRIQAVVKKLIIEDY